MRDWLWCNVRGFFSSTVYDGAAGAQSFGDTPKDKFYLATEKNVRPDSPPFFIWQTLSDDGRHGLCLAKALQDAGVPYELHILKAAFMD